MLRRVLRLSLPVLALTGPVVQAAGCPEVVPAIGAIVHRTIAIRGTGEHRIELPKVDLPIVVRVDEVGIDVVVEIRDAKHNLLARSASPVIRTGSQLAYVEPGTPKVAILRSVEHPGHSGSAKVVVRPVTATGVCSILERALASADMRYAEAKAASDSELKAGDVPASKIYEDAAKRYETAHALPDLSPAQQALLELVLASIEYYDLSDWTASADWATHSTTNFEKTKDVYAQARARAILAAAWMELGTKSASDGTGIAVPTDSRSRFDEARKLLKELEKFHLKRGEGFDAALQTNNIGLAYYYEARFAEAIPPYLAGMNAFENLGETPRVALALQNIALCEWGQGKLTAALPRFDRAIELMNARAHPDLYLLTLNSSALAHYAAGKFDKSLQLHTRARDFAKQVQNPTFHGRSLMGLGITYYAIGDHRLAAQMLRSALDVLSSELDSRGHTTTLRSLAIIAHREGRYSEAVSYNLEALKSSASTAARAQVKIRLASDYLALGDFSSARKELEPVEREPPNNSPLIRADAKLELARLLRAGRDVKAAEKLLIDALADFQSMQSVAGEFDARVELARIQSETNREGMAILTLRDALKLSDEIATQTGNPEYRASVSESLRPAQELMVDLMYARFADASKSGDDRSAREIAGESLAFADATRARIFGQVLAQRFRREGPALAHLLTNREVLLRDLADRRFYLSTREDRRGPDDPVAKALRDDIAGLRARLGVTNTEIANLSAGPDVTPAKWSLTLGRPPGRLLVHYWLGAKNAYVWTVSSTKTTWIKLDDSDAIGPLARKAHESLKRVAVTGRDSAAERAERQRTLENLHELLVRPLNLTSDVHEIVIAADGPLHVVPFAALRGSGDRDPYLVQQASVAFVPALRFAATATGTAVYGRRTSRALVVNDPVYSATDNRISQPSPSLVAQSSDLSSPLWRSVTDLDRLTRLTSSAKEGAEIRRELSSKYGASSVDVLEGLDATRDAFLRRNLASYRFIHIASHGVIDTEIPQLSALILGKFGRTGAVRNQQVWVDDLLTQSFDAELVILSACDTSLGPEFSGEGPIGLRYAVLARGATSVVSSLWPVSDEITAILMTDVYGEMTNNAKAPEEAVAIAMRKLLLKRPELDPFLWSQYVVHQATRRTH